MREGAAAEGVLTQGVNDFRKAGYGGPCPPHADGPHRYLFRLLALECEKLRIPPRPSCRAVEQAARGELLDESVLLGVYAR